MYRAAFAPESMIIMIFAFVRINPFRLQINIINKIDLFCCCSTSDYPTPYISNDSSSGKGDGGRRHWHVRVSYTFWLCIIIGTSKLYIYVYAIWLFLFTPCCVRIAAKCVPEWHEAHECVLGNSIICASSLFVPVDLHQHRCHRSRRQRKKEYNKKVSRMRWENVVCTESKVIRATNTPAYLPT